MTALEALIDEVYTYGYESGSGEKTKPWGEFNKHLANRYSVTLRTSSESADDVKPEQGITDKELVAKIEDIVQEFDYRDLYGGGHLQCAVIKLENLFKAYKTMPNSLQTTFWRSMNTAELLKTITKAFDENIKLNKQRKDIWIKGRESFILELSEKLFEPSKSSSEQNISQDQMMSQIEDMAVCLNTSNPLPFSESYLRNTQQFKHFQQELKDCFKRHFGEK